MQGNLGAHQDKNVNLEIIRVLDLKLREFFEELRREIIETVSVYFETVQNVYDLKQIHWQRVKGFRGEYERSEDVNNPHFKALHKDLVRHNGKMVKDGYFIWLFKNGTTIGRKRRGSNGS